jgi:hypothetical protein
MASPAQPVRPAQHTVSRPPSQGPWASQLTQLNERERAAVGNAIRGLISSNKEISKAYDSGQLGVAAVLASEVWEKELTRDARARAVLGDAALGLIRSNEKVSNAYDSGQLGGRAALLATEAWERRVMREARHQHAQTGEAAANEAQGRETMPRLSAAEHFPPESMDMLRRDAATAAEWIRRYDLAQVAEGYTSSAKPFPPEPTLPEADAVAAAWLKAYPPATSETYPASAIAQHVSREVAFVRPAFADPQDRPVSALSRFDPSEQVRPVSALSSSDVIGLRSEESMRAEFAKNLLPQAAHEVDIVLQATPGQAKGVAVTPHRVDLQGQVHAPKPRGR